MAEGWRRIASRISLGVLALVVLAAAAAWWGGMFAPSQRLAGRLTEYHAVFDGLWDVACDTALDGSDQRCYLQYVDVYRPRPDFAAAMVELVWHRGSDGQPDPAIRFDIEPGLSFRDARIAVSSGQRRVRFDLSGCPTNSCVFSGDEGRAMITALRDGATLELEIDEGRAAPVRLRWPLGQMAAMLDDLAAQRARRGLP